MYTYSLMCCEDEGYVPVRPGPDMEIPTVEVLREQVEHDLGFVPEWLQYLRPTEYVGVEDNYNIHGVWFCVCIEGSQEHTLPPLAQMIAFEKRHKKAV